MTYALGDWAGPLGASQLTADQLWMASLALGADLTRTTLDGILDGSRRPSVHEHNVLAHALNEQLHDLDLDWPVPYRD
jgi:hypothetical protein